MRKETFEKMKDKYGEYSSWTNWDGVDLRNPGEEFINKIDDSIIFVAYNLSNIQGDKRRVKPFSNFHGNNYKKKIHLLPHAIKKVGNGIYYMTDVIKFQDLNGSICIEKDAKKVKLSESVEKLNLDFLEEEIKDLGNNPNLMIVALGGAVQSIFRRHGWYEKCHIENMSHYARQSYPKESYEEELVNIFRKNGKFPTVL